MLYRYNRSLVVSCSCFRIEKQLKDVLKQCFSASIAAWKGDNIHAVVALTQCFTAINVFSLAKNPYFFVIYRFSFSILQLFIYGIFVIRIYIKEWWTCGVAMFYCR